MHLYVNFCVSFLSSWVLISHICFLQLRSEFLGRNLQGRGPGSALALPPVTGPSWAGGLWGYIFPMDSPPGPSARAGAGQVDPRAPGGTEGTSSGAGRGCLSRGLPVPGDARGGDGSYSSLQPGRSRAVASEALALGVGSHNLASLCRRGWMDTSPRPRKSVFLRSVRVLGLKNQTRRLIAAPRSHSVSARVVRPVGA